MDRLWASQRSISEAHGVQKRDKRAFCFRQTLHISTCSRCYGHRPHAFPSPHAKSICSTPVPVPSSMPATPINMFLARGARHPRAHASPAAVVAVSKLSDVSSSLVGNLPVVACLPGAFVPAGLNQSTIDDYKKSGALVFYDASAPLQLLLTQEQNRKFLTSLMSGAFKIGDVR